MRSSNKGHPWSDESDGEGSLTTTKSHSIGPIDTSESETTTRRSTRMYNFSSFFYYCSRRRAFSPQTFVSQDSEDSDSEPSSPFVVMTTPDSGSKIERILGRRVLPNTEEEAFILKHNRLAIVYES